MPRTAKQQADIDQLCEMVANALPGTSVAKAIGLHSFLPAAASVCVDIERIADALESIAASLEKMANPRKPDLSHVREENAGVMRRALLRASRDVNEL